MKKIFSKMIVATVVLLASAGCELDKQLEELEKGDAVYEPKYVLSVHDIVKYPKAKTMLERPVDTYSGSSIYVNVNYLLHSKNIEKIEMVQRKEPGFYDLRLTLDRRGFLMWSGFSYRSRGRKLACIIDGLCYREFVPAKPTADHKSDDEVPVRIVTLEGPFDEVTAANLQKYSEKNYKHYNP